MYVENLQQNVSSLTSMEGYAYALMKSFGRYEYR